MAEVNNSATTSERKQPMDEGEQKTSAIPIPKSSAKLKTPELPVSERRNWLIHLHYTRGNFDVCKALIQEQLRETCGLCEYAVYCQAMILRREGKIQESLDLFQTCTVINPNSTDNLKQVALSLYLQGRHKAALDVYSEALKIHDKDWEILHNVGLCHMHLGNLLAAKENLKMALSYSRHDMSYRVLAKVYLVEHDVAGAIDVYTRAAAFYPENCDILSSLGLLLLQVGQYQKAFEHLGNAMTFDPNYVKSIIAAGSMMQLHSDNDVALSKYRVAAQHAPESAPLWNNIGMCFFGKKRLVAAISCLKRAHYLAPFDWKVAYNLGLVHLNMQQYASAFHFLRCAIRWKPNLAQAYGLLAISLSHLDDKENAQRAYDHALSLEENDPSLHLNYAVFLYKNDDRKAASKQLCLFEQSINVLKKKNVPIDQELIEMATKLGPSLQVGETLLWKEPDVKNPPSPLRQIISNCIGESES